MKYLKYILVAIVLAISAPLTAQTPPSIQNWTAQPGYANSVQAQLNSLQAQINALGGGGGGTPGGTTGQIQYNNSSAFGGFTLGGDCTVNVTTGIITCTKSSGTGFAALAFLGIGPNLQSRSGNLTTSGIPSNVINVEDPQYGALGNGLTDDTAAIQSAIAAACADSTNKREVYLPATPGGSYHITSPILLNCGLMKFTGAGWRQTQFTQNYFGPTLLAQGAESGWKPPLASSISATWTASHTYSQYNEINDSNGCVEVATTGGMSGSGSHPSWPTCLVSSVGTTTSDGAATWTLEMVGSSLATGSGSALDGVSPEFFPGAGYGTNNATIEVASPANLEQAIQGLSSWSIEFYVNVVVATNSGNQFGLLGYRGGAPGGNVDAFKITLLDGTGSCTHNCLQATMDIGGVSTNINSALSGANMAPNTIHEVELNHDSGTNTANLFLDGVLIKSVSATGTWTIPKYSTFLLADQGAQCYLCGQFNFNAQVNILPAYYDSLRISKIARHTSGFTPPTAKFTQDANTVFLLNYPTTAPTGTLKATVGTAATNAFIPVETSNGAAALNPVEISDMRLADNGLYATWMINSTVRNLWIEGNGRACVNLANNDYQDKILNVSCQTSANTAITNVGFVFGNQSNNNYYYYLQADGTQTNVIVEGGSGKLESPDFGDFGNAAIYPYVFYQTFGFSVSSGVTDIEDSPTVSGLVYLKSNTGPINFDGGFYTIDGTVTSLVTQNGGSPAIFSGVKYQGTIPTEIVNVISTPTSPVVFKDTPLLCAPLTNAGNGASVLLNPGTVGVSNTNIESYTSVTPIYANYYSGCQ